MTTFPPRYWSQYLPLLKQKGVNEALGSVFFKDTPLNRWLRRTLTEEKNPHALMSTPVFESLFPWKSSGKTLKKLEKEGLFSHETLRVLSAPSKPESAFPMNREVYELQYEAFSHLLNRDARHSVIVSSGTGSGKTECFMLPLIEDLIREWANPATYQPGLRALMLYPLNALSESQRERLQNWTHDCPDDRRIRFVIYNGDTPEKNRQTDIQERAQKHPEEVFDRYTMRQVMPQIMLTNPTMLERMLLNPKDAGLVEQTRQAKSFRWVILDEAHTYLGSKAANLALLLRRMLNAFGVDPCDVHFVATSATVNASDAKACENLKKFLMDISGTSADRVHLVLGQRDLPPTVPTQDLKDQHSLDTLEALPSEELEAALRDSKTAMRIRNRFIAYEYQSLEDIATALHLSKHDALRWLDLLTAIAPDDQHHKPALLTLRLHQFFNTTDTVSACVDPQCPHKDAELQDPNWHFGQVWLDGRRECTCGAPVLPLGACYSCNSVVLKGDFDHFSIYYPSSAEKDAKNWQTLTDNGVSDISQDLTPTELLTEDIELSPNNQESQKAEETETTPLAQDMDLALLMRDTQPVLVVNDPSVSEAQPFELIPNPQKDPSRSLFLHLLFPSETPSGLRYTCPCCHKANRWEQFYTRRVSSRYVHALMPCIVEHCSTPKADPSLPKHGRKLITFTDSRQGTAKTGALLEREGEYSFTVTTVYQKLLAQRDKANSKESAVDELRKRIDPTELSPEIWATLTAALQKSSPQSPSTTEVTWSEVIEELRQQMVTDPHHQCPTVHLLHSLFLGSRISDSDAREMCQILLLREFLYRPKNGATLETCGLVSVQYPKIENVTVAPPEWPDKLGLQSWKNYLKWVLDFVVRAHTAVKLTNRWYTLGGNRRLRAKTYVSPNYRGTLGLKQLRWPQVLAKTPTHSADFVLLTGKLLGVDFTTPQTITRQQILAINSVLQTAFNELRRVGLLQDSLSAGQGYVLDPEDMSFRLNTKAWAFRNSNKLYDTVIFDPNLGPSSAMCPQNSVWVGAQEISLPQLVEEPHIWQDDYQAARTSVQKQLAQSSAFQNLLDAGYWNHHGTMALERTGYFSATEHSAQLNKVLRSRYVDDFKKGTLNILSCSTTMEMGVDLSSINSVVMMTVPPYPANYLQRAGRAGRRGETRSNTFIVAGASPRDQEVFHHPDWALKGAKPNLKVALDSERIVTQNVHAQLLALYLNHPEFYSEDALTIKSWIQQNGLLFLDWLVRLQQTPSTAAFAYKLIQRITHFSSFETRPLAFWCQEATKSMKALLSDWTNESKRYSQLLKDFPKNDIVTQAIDKQSERFNQMPIYEALTRSLWLPSTICITNVTEFDFHELRKESKKKSVDNKKAYDLPSRPSHMGIHEYAPDTPVVIDHGVYRSAGLMLKWRSPTSSSSVKEIQQLKTLVRCQHCGHQFLLSKSEEPTSCPVCLASKDKLEVLEAILPAGFCVDAHYHPNNDLTALYQKDRLPNDISLSTAIHPVGTSEVLECRSSTMATLISVNTGNGQGYAVCLKCGWSKLEKSDGELQDFSHYPLRTVNSGLCVGGTQGHEFQLKRHLHLVAESATDALEIHFKGAVRQLERNSKRVESAGFGIGIALRRAIAEYLGIEEDELGIIVPKRRSMLTGDLIVVLFDHIPSGYTSHLEDVLPDLLRRAYHILHCPRHCNTVCGACLLTFDTRHQAQELDRHDALAVLNETCIQNLSQ